MCRRACCSAYYRCTAGSCRGTRAQPGQRITPAARRARSSPPSGGSIDVPEQPGLGVHRHMQYPGHLRTGDAIGSHIVRRGRSPVAGRRTRSRWGARCSPQHATGLISSVPCQAGWYTGNTPSWWPGARLMPPSPDERPGLLRTSAQPGMATIARPRYRWPAGRGRRATHRPPHAA